MTTLTILPGKAGDNTEIPSQSPASGAHWDKQVAIDGTYVYISGEPTGPYHLDLYGWDAVVKGGKINSVTAHIYVRCNGDYESRAKCALKSHGTVYYGDENVWTGYLVWHDYSYQWLLNPYTSSLWTWSEIYELQFGIDLKGQAVSCEMVWLVVDYTVENVKPGLIDMGMM